MPLGHVDEIMLVVFESDSCSFLELLRVIDINEIVVFHLLMAGMARIMSSIMGRLRLVVELIRRTFAFDTGDSQLTGLCFDISSLFVLARLFDVCPRDLPLCSMAACSHLRHFKCRFIVFSLFLKFIRSLPSFPRMLTSRTCALVARHPSFLSLNCWINQQIVL